jgi:radical SAM superfamily enzyme YgiQ (UPF0313 family)
MRIGLIAMSGIRVRDEELLRLGLTLPGFVERSKTIASLPSLGLLTLAGMTPANHQVQYVEVPDARLLPAPPAGFDLVAISSYSAQIGEAYELAEKYREMGIPVVMGGPHVSCLPGEALEHGDCVVVGEGEVVWPEVLSDRERGALKPLYGSLEQSFDLGSSPMPSFEMLDISKYNRLTVQTSRGCPHRCEFCASSVTLVGRYKQKPAEKVLAEIDRILGIWRHPFIEFADDNTFVDKSYWKELLPLLGQRHIRWFTETDISVAEDDGLLSLIRESGCAQLLIGLESPVEAGLDGLETRGNWKLRRWPRYEDAIRNIQSHGITVNGCFVIGLDGHGPEIFDRVFDFVRKSELYEVQVTILTPFPCTPLYDRLKREKRLVDETDWGKCTLFDINYAPKNMSAGELSRGFKDLVVRLYSEEFTRLRRENFKKYLKKAKKVGGTIHER